MPPNATPEEILRFAQPLWVEFGVGLGDSYPVDPACFVYAETIFGPFLDKNWSLFSSNYQTGAKTPGQPQLRCARRAGKVAARLADMQVGVTSISPQIFASACNAVKRLAMRAVRLGNAPPPTGWTCS